MMTNNSISMSKQQYLCKESFRNRSKFIQQFSERREKSPTPNISIKVLRRANSNIQDLPLQDRDSISQMKKITEDLEINKNTILNNCGDKLCN